MSLQLGQCEDLDEGLKRLIVEQCRLAVEAIDRADDDEGRHVAVHDVRKALKKVRACLRLVRDRIGDYRERNAYFRDLARPISDVRDATANLETLAKLRSQYDGTLSDGAFSGIRDRLIAHRASLAERNFRQEDRLGGIRRELQTQIEEIPGWRWQVTGFDDIRPGIARMYRRGCRALRRCGSGGSIRDFHEWRKLVKYLRYQVDTLNRVWPEYMETLEAELHRLSDAIGELHDLDVLAQAVERTGTRASATDEELLFTTLLTQRQQQLAGEALLLGSRCYQASPVEFCNALDGYWASWEQGTRLAT